LSANVCQGITAAGRSGQRDYARCSVTTYAFTWLEVRTTFAVEDVALDFYRAHLTMQSTVR